MPNLLAITPGGDYLIGKPAHNEAEIDFGRKMRQFKMLLRPLCSKGRTAQ
jgi:hypothetical protein